MEGHDLSALKPADNDLLVTDEVVDIVRKLLVDNSENRAMSHFWLRLTIGALIKYAG